MDFDDPTEMRDEGYGLGMSLDQEITNALTAFARIGWQDDDVYAVEYAWSLGLQVSGCLWGRDDDVFGIAYARSETGEDYRNSLRAAGLRTAAAEETFEAYYNYRVNGNVSISPDIQLAKRHGRHGKHRLRMDPRRTRSTGFLITIHIAT